jgi:diacylglycerol kinase family enzyme
MGIPAFVNPESGSARDALAALEQAPEFEVRHATAGELPGLLAREVRLGTRRVLVAGGDGTVARAAATLAGTGVALAVLPGGTLNHFARFHGIPGDVSEALALAASGPEAMVDAGYLNDELFVGTSSIGAYSRYVRTREGLEPLLGYWLGSVLAGLRVLASLRPMVVQLAVDGTTGSYTSPLVFVAVGERKLGIPGLGQPAPDGRRGLHVVVPRGRREARRFASAYHRLRRGTEIAPRAIGVDSAVVDRLELAVHRPTAEVALDGEIRRVSSPLVYRFAPDALCLVTNGAPR